jgi:hypothetical protein
MRMAYLTGRGARECVHMGMVPWETPAAALAALPWPDLPELPLGEALAGLAQLCACVALALAQCWLCWQLARWLVAAPRAESMGQKQPATVSERFSVLN